MLTEQKNFFFPYTLYIEKCVYRHMCGGSVLYSAEIYWQQLLPINESVMWL